MFAAATAALAFALSGTTFIVAETQIGWETPITAASFVVLALTGFVWFKPAVDQLQKAKDEQIIELRAHLDRVTGQRDKMLESQAAQVAALAQSTTAVARSSEVLERIVPILDRIAP